MAVETNRVVNGAEEGHIYTSEKTPSQSRSARGIHIEVAVEAAEPGRGGNGASERSGRSATSVSRLVSFHSLGGYGIQAFKATSRVAIGPRGDTGTALSWLQATFLICGDTFGLGALFVPSAYGKLGFVWGTAAMLIFAAVSLYSLLLLYAFKHRFMPTAGSFGNAAAFLAGPRAGRVVEQFVHFFWVMAMLLSFGVSRAALEDIGSGLAAAAGGANPLLTWHYGMLTAALLLPFTFLKSLAGASWVSLLSSLGVFAAMLILTVDYMLLHSSTGTHRDTSAAQHAPPVPLIVPDDAADATDGAGDEDPLWYQAMGSFVDPALSIVLFFFTHDAAFEIMDDMAESRKFRRAAIVAFGVSGAVAIAICAACVALGMDGGMAESLVGLCNEPGILATVGLLVCFKGVSTYVRTALVLQANWFDGVLTWAAENAAAAAVRERLEQPDDKKPRDAAPPEERPLPPSSSSLSGSSFRLGARRRLIALVNREGSQSLIWVALGLLVLGFATAFSVLFPWVDLVASLTASVCGAPVMFGLPAFFALWGAAKRGARLGPVDALCSRVLLYLISPALVAVGVVWVSIEAVQRYGGAVM